MGRFDLADPGSRWECADQRSLHRVAQAALTMTSAPYGSTEGERGSRSARERSAERDTQGEADGDPNQEAAEAGHGGARASPLVVTTLCSCADSCPQEACAERRCRDHPGTIRSVRFELELVDFAKRVALLAVRIRDPQLLLAHARAERSSSSVSAPVRSSTRARSAAKVSVVPLV